MPTSAFWDRLAALPSGLGTSLDWAWAFGADLDRIRPFLLPTTESAESVPCPARPACGCRHRVRDGGEGLVAICGCDPPECAPRPIQREDALVLRLDREQLGAALAGALELGPPMRADAPAPGGGEIGTLCHGRVSVGLVFQRPERWAVPLLEAAARNVGRPIVLLHAQRGALDAETLTALACAAGSAVWLGAVAEPPQEGVFSPAAGARSLLRAAASDAIARAAAGVRAWQSVRRELAGMRSALGSPPEPEPATEQTARQLFAIVKELELSARCRKAPILQVFRLYCIEGLTPRQVARQCGCSRALVVLRLQQLEKRLGRHPSQLRSYSSHFEQIESSLSDPRARRIHREAAAFGDGE